MHNSSKILQATYFKNVHNKRIFLIGIETPPFGGVSIHISRKISYLKNNNKIFIFDVIKEGQPSKIKYSFKLLVKLLSFKPDIIYYHTLFLRKNLNELILLILWCLLSKCKLTLIEHSVRFLYKHSPFYIKIFNFLVRYIHQVILIGQPMLQGYLDKKIAIKKHFLIESSFICPQLDLEEETFNSYPTYLLDFFKNHKKIMIMNASKFDLWDGQDIYGFDLCLKLMRDLKNDNIGLIMAVGSIFNDRYYQHIKNQINPQNTLLLLNMKQEIWPLIKRADLFLRPSRFDNYSVSVAEALFFEKIVIASNIGERPANTILFKCGDYNDFKNKVEGCLRS